MVHENHGLGIYRGIEKVEVDKVVKDYIKIEYAKGGNLYILETQLELIQKYAGADAKKPKLNKLGTQEWSKTKSKVHKAVADIAQDLVNFTQNVRTGKIMYMAKIPYGNGNLRKCSRLRRRKIRSLPLKLPSRTWRARRSWTV